MSRHTEVQVNDVCSCDICGQPINGDGGGISGLRQCVLVGNRTVDVTYDIKAFLYDSQSAQDICPNCRASIIKAIAERY